VGYRSTNQTVYSAKYHLIWCPKYRRNVLVSAVDERLKEILSQVTGEIGRPSQAVFCCLACGHAEHADVNAAKNICARGLRVPARGGRPDVGAPSEARTPRREAA
jgi:transposase